MDIDISTYTEQVLSAFINLIISGVVKSVRHQGNEITFLASKCGDASNDILSLGLHGGLSLCIQEQLEVNSKNPNKEAAQNGHCSIILSAEETIQSNHTVKIPITDDLAAASSHSDQTSNLGTVTEPAAHMDTIKVACNLEFDASIPGDAEYIPTGDVEFSQTTDNDVDGPAENNDDETLDEEQEVQIKLEVQDDLQMENDDTMTESFLNPEQTNSAAATNTLSSNTSYENLQGRTKCKYCNYTTMRKSSLICHMRTHTREKHFACPECPFRCTRKESLKKHILTHNGKEPFACPECPYRSARQSSMKKHILTHGKKHTGCPECPYISYRPSDMKRHILSHTQAKPLECPECPYRATDTKHLKEHILLHNGKKHFGCPKCLYISDRQSNIRRHVLSHSQAKPFACPECPYSATLETNLKRHIRTHSGEKPFACQYCSFRSAHKSNVKQHALKHTTENHLLLDTSNTRRVNESVAHVNTINIEGNSGNPVSIPITDDPAAAGNDPTSNTRTVMESASHVDNIKVECYFDNDADVPVEYSSGDRFIEREDVGIIQSSEETLQTNHTVSISDNLVDTNKVQCTPEASASLAGFTKYSPNADINEQVEYNGGERLIECQEQGLQIKTEFPNDLQIELDRSTTWSFPFTSDDPTDGNLSEEKNCQYCEFKTSYKSRLITHMRTHTADKPYACTECPYRSLRRGDLRYHILTHTGEKPFACPECPFRCRHKSNLIAHTRKRHSVDTKTAQNSMKCIYNSF